MNIKEISYFLTVFTVMPFMLSSKSVVEGGLRVKRSTSSYSRHPGEFNDMITVASETDICNAENEESSDSERVRRSIQNWLSNETTTTEAPEEEIDVSLLSPQFKNCIHVIIEPECYQKFHNGSVFVPIYNMLFDRSNYVISKKMLFVCPEFWRNYAINTGFNNSELGVSDMTTVANEIDICNIEKEESSDSERMRRNVLNWISNETTTTEAPEEEVDLSLLSPKFLNCTHIFIEPECYQKFENGSVFVPIYNMLFDRSNYVIYQKMLFVCPDFGRNYATNTGFNNSELGVSDMTTVANEIDICNIEKEESSDSERMRRNVLNWISNETTTTEAPEEEVDLSLLSPEFLNCIHTFIEPECYQKFENGSVFVPLYNILFDRSNYIIYRKLLFVCPDYIILRLTAGK